MDFDVLCQILIKQFAFVRLLEKNGSMVAAIYGFPEGL